MTIQKSINLYFKNDTSDKVYNVQLIEVDGGFTVHAQNGKRGSKLKNNIKHETPVTLAEAEKTYTSLVKTKTKEGYSENATGGVFQSDVYEERFTGIIGQMLNKVTDAEKYINDVSFVAQEKFDGTRHLVKIVAGVPQAINKKGLEIPFLPEVVEPLLALKKDLLIDGELVNGVYNIFDLVEFDGVDLRGMPMAKRYEKLKALGLPNTAYTAFTKAEKQALYDKLSAENREGIVFKKSTSEYVSGRPNSGGDQLKLKFYATDTFEVVAHNKGKRSVKIVSYTETGEQYDMGNVTIPANFDIPEIGSFIEVRYLYCHVDGKLFQTTMLNVRVDQDRSDCHMREIKFKALTDEDDE